MDICPISLTFVWQCWLVVLEMAPYLLFGFALAGPDVDLDLAGVDRAAPGRQGPWAGCEGDLAGDSAAALFVQRDPRGGFHAAAWGEPGGGDLVPALHAADRGRQHCGDLRAVGAGVCRFRPDRRLDHRRPGRGAGAGVRTGELRGGRGAAGMYRCVLFGRPRGAGLAAGGQAWVRDPAARSGLAAPGRRGDRRGDRGRVARRQPARGILAAVCFRSSC